MAASDNSNKVPPGRPPRTKRLLVFIVAALLLVSGGWFTARAYRTLCHTYISFTGGSIVFEGANKGGYIGIIRQEFYKMGRGDIKTLYFGAGGMRSTDLLQRIDRVLSARSNVVVILVGANDVLRYYTPVSEGNSIEVYESTLRAIIKKIRQRGVGVVICSPVIVGERDYSKPALNTDLDNSTRLLKTPRRKEFTPARADYEVGLYAQRAHEVAVQEGVDYCDLRKAFKDYLAAHNAENRLEGILTYDGTHPNALGHKLIAGTLFPVLRDNKAIKKEPPIRRIFRPFTNRKDPLFWKTLSRFDKSIK